MLLSAHLRSGEQNAYATLGKPCAFIGGYRARPEPLRSLSSRREKAWRILGLSLYLLLITIRWVGGHPLGCYYSLAKFIVIELRSHTLLLRLGAHSQRDFHGHSSQVGQWRQQRRRGIF
jgi:hypothetical protein